jgi:ATP-dependent DNA helicase DinG
MALSRDNCSNRSAAVDALTSAGPLARIVEGFAPRDVQQRMAEAVEVAIRDRAELVVEAGTGTGKTFAYLVPALLSGKRVIISTGTKTLQDQLFHRDLPRVREALGVRLKSALLKGRSNYLCRYRLDQARREGQFTDRADPARLTTIAAWATRTKSGDCSELTGIPEDAGIWPRVTSTSDNCLGKECPFFDDCFVVKARREAQEADLVVVNHHLLFADLAIKRDGFGEILPGAQAFVLDEAHQVPELAGQFFSVALSARQLLELEADSLREAAAESGAKAALDRLGRGVEAKVKSFRLAIEGLPTRGALRVLLDREGVEASLDALGDVMADLAAALESMAERSEGLSSCHARAAELVTRLSRLSSRPEPGWVHWYELTERGFVLSATPLDVAQPLRAFREQTNAAWIFTSATLTVGERFDHFLIASGLEEPATLALPSPFDFERNALCWLPTGLPPPNAPGYTEAVCATLRPALRASGGRAFLLFTSHRALKRAAELLADLPYPLFVQGTLPRAMLLEQFRAAGNGVLLGAASFWEGVDVRGEALSLVAIDKLPFASPDDPVLEARISASREAGGNPFMEIQIPAAAIALKQGAGRLIRDVGDRGVLAICDPRVLTARYGRLFLESLPPMPITQAISDIDHFFAGAGPSAPTG